METKPEGDALDDEQLLRQLHHFLLETTISQGKLVCENCDHEYPVKDGIPNFLLPGHLGMVIGLLSVASVAALCTAALLTVSPV